MYYIHILIFKRYGLFDKFKYDSRAS